MPILAPHPDLHPPDPGPGVLAALLDASPAGRLDDAGKATLLAVLTAPLAVSLVAGTTDDATRGRLSGELARRGVPTAVAAAWLVGLVAAGHAPRTLAALGAAGWLARWELPGLASVTLSAWAAAAIGVELGEFGDDDDPETAWRPIDPRPCPVRIRQRIAGGDAVAWAVDPRPGPAEAEDLRRREQRCAAILEGLGLGAPDDGPPGRTATRPRRRGQLGRPATAAGSKGKPKPRPRPSPGPKPKPRDQARRNSFDLEELKACLG